MDTSPEYINMCRQATELQEKWEPKDGDWVYNVPPDGWCVAVVGGTSFDVYAMERWDSIDEASTKIADCVWLPRIDQLIELSTIHWSDIIDYCGLEYSDYKLSFEIALLKIVMYKVFNKVWNGEDWI